MPIELGSTPDEVSINNKSSEPERVSISALLNRQTGHKPIPLEHRVAFNDQFALLLETGVPLHTALGELIGKSANADVAKILAAVREDLVEGMPLSDAFAQHPHMFDVTYVNVVASGEAGGFLPKALKQLQELDERSMRMREIVSSAITYPLVLLVTSVLVVGFILLWVFPRFAELFDSMGDKLPFLTLMLIKLSNFLRDHWLALICSLAAVGVLSWRALRQPATQAKLDTFLLNLPVLGPILCQVHLVPTLRVLSLSLGNGVPMVKALVAARAVTASPSFNSLIDRVVESVTEGETASKVFNESPLLPDLSRQMITTGEATGNLAMVTAKLCDHYERQLEKELRTLTKMIEPIMLFTMSLVIGGIVAALILPIFKMSAMANDDAAHG